MCDVIEAEKIIERKKRPFIPRIPPEDLGNSPRRSLFDRLILHITKIVLEAIKTEQIAYEQIKQEAIEAAVKNVLANELHSSRLTPPKTRPVQSGKVDRQ